MLIFFITRHGAWQFKKYGWNASYHYYDWNPWNSPTYSLGTAAWKNSATLLRENLPSLHAGGPGADHTDHQELTDDTWSGLRHERERERNQVCLAADIPPSRVSTEQAYKPCIVWGPGSVLTALGQQEVPQLLLWIITQVQQSFSTSFLTRTDDKYQTSSSTMDPFSVLFLIGALIFLSLGLAALWHYILGPYLSCILWVRANFNQDNNNTC